MTTARSAQMDGTSLRPENIVRVATMVPPYVRQKGTTRIQAINGKFLYYARAVDLYMLPAINEILSQQAKPTQVTNNKVSMLMDYAHLHHDAVICYHASDMQLHINSDAVCLVLPKARSHGAGNFCLSNNIDKTHAIPAPTPSGLILVKCVTLRNVMSSAAETEISTVHHNKKVSVQIITALRKMEHIQGPIPLKIENATAEGFLKRNMLVRTTIVRRTGSHTDAHADHSVQVPPSDIRSYVFASRLTFAK